MAESLSDQIICKIKDASDLYHRLILVVAPAGTGKTKALRDVKKRISTCLINVNLELSRLMLDLTKRQRALQLPKLLMDIVNDVAGDVVLLDNIEILCAVSLEQDPLRLLQGLSRNKTVVVAWNGTIDRNYVTYAEPDHPEYRRYTVSDFLVVSPQVIT